MRKKKLNTSKQFNMENKIKVVELFAGVGGFRLGLEALNEKSASSGYKKDLKSAYKVVWSNQWEPTTKTQHASIVYEKHFGKDGITGLFENHLGVTLKGRAIRSNLFFVPQKRIFTSIPNAKAT